MRRIHWKASARRDRLVVTEWEGGGGTGAEVVLGWGERLPNGEGFGLHFVPVPDAVSGSDLAASAAALNGVVERCVRQRPEQALWSYRRFRIRPPNAAESSE